MKIALVNYRYFFSGGPERYMFNIKEILEKHGHTVIPFSVKHNKNVPTPYDKYFLEPIGTGNEVYAGEYKKNFRNTCRVVSRMLYSFEAKRKFRYFLQQEKPDIVYILYFQSKISCSIIDAAYQMKIPVVQRISDFSLICPCNILYRYDTNQICELCLGKNKWSAIKYKCVYDSRLYSFLKVLAIGIQNKRKIQSKIDRFIFPSAHTLQKFSKAGFPFEKLSFIPTLFNPQTLRNDLLIDYQDYALYIGRTDPDKGLETLLDAFIGTEYKLKIIGFSSVNGYYEHLLRYIENKNCNIEFLGKMSFQQMQEYLSKCLFTLIPSEWYDNLPNTLLESFAFRKCVVATNIGSLKENIIHEKNGLLFDYKSCTSLRKQISRLFDNPAEAVKYGENAYSSIGSTYSIENHYQSLISIFKSTIDAKSRNN